MNPRVEQLLNELNEFTRDLGNGAPRRADGMYLSELLAQQDDEVLAGAICCAGSFRNAIIEELLVTRRRVELIRLLRVLGAEFHTAENLVQDLCIKVLKGALDDFDVNKEFGRYLRTIVRNLFRSSRRRRQPVFTEDMHESLGPDKVDQRVELRETLSQFAEAMRDFPELEQRIMRLTGEGWTPGEIANELGMEVRSIYPRIAHCRQYLIDLIDPSLPPATRGRPRLDDSAD